MRIGYLIIGFFIIEFVYSQYPIFSSPMKYPIELSGTFAEIRSVNFHSGIDIKVSNRTDRNVYAIDDGWVSRIKIQATGYGRAIYIDHPSGYTSVYAHLDRFSSDIEQLVLKLQYQKQTFEIDVTFPADSILIKKNQFIGVAGNTGYSSGPHLHFEIRDSRTQEAMDPLLFGIKHTDQTAPEFESLKIYIHGNSLINGQNNHVVIPLTLRDRFTYEFNEVIEISGPISFGFAVRDRQSSNNKSRLGIKQLQLWINDTLWFFVKFDRLSFNVLRHQLAYIDFPSLKTEKKHYHITWRKPGNKLPIYHLIQNEGIFTPTDERIYNIKCKITDAAGNEAMLIGRIKGKKSPEKYVFHLNCLSGQHLIKYDSSFTWQGNHWFLFFDKFTLFSDQCFLIYEHSENNYAMPSKKISITSDVPPAKSYLIGFTIDTLLNDKTIIAHVDDKGKKTGIVPNFDGKTISAYTTLYGDFICTYDTVGPIIKPINIPTNGIINNLKTLRFYVQDDLTGIARYEGYANDKWLLLQYELKDNELKYVIDEHLPSGSFDFRIIVKDGLGNHSMWQQRLIR